MTTWIKVTDALPEIPEGKYGITVLVTIFDSIYEEVAPGYGSHVSTASFGRDGIFKTLYYANDDVEWGPSGDPVIAWQYMPEPCYTSEAITILKAIIDDATGDSLRQKQTWPIRAENYRKAVKVIEYANNKT